MRADRNLLEGARRLAYEAYATISPWYRAGRLGHYRGLFAASERWPDHVRDDWQLERVRTLVAAAETTPFYASRLRDAGVSSASLRSWDDFARVPLTDRTTIASRTADLHPPNAPRFRPNATSGSTGRPLRVRTPAEMDAAGRAARWRMMGWFGVPFGAPTLTIASGNARRGRLLDATWLVAEAALGQAFVDAYRVEPEAHLAALLRVRPEVVIGHPSAVAVLAREAESRGHGGGGGAIGDRRR